MKNTDIINFIYKTKLKRMKTLIPKKLKNLTQNRKLKD